MPVWCTSGSVFLLMRIPPKCFLCIMCIPENDFVCPVCIPKDFFVYLRCIPRTVVPASVQQAPKFWGAELSPTRTPPPPWKPHGRTHEIRGV